MSSADVAYRLLLYKAVAHGQSIGPAVQPRCKITCNRMAPDAAPRVAVPDPAPPSDAGLPRMVSERAAAPCAGFCVRLTLSSAATALAAPSAACTLLFSDSLLLLACAPSTLLATVLQVCARSDRLTYPRAKVYRDPYTSWVLLCTADSAKSFL